MPPASSKSSSARSRPTAVAEQVAGRLAWEAAQLEPSEAALAVGALEGRREAIGYLTRACGHHDEHGRVGRAAQERGEQLHRRGVRPVDVVEGEHERPGGRQPLEQLAHRAVGAVALVLRRGSPPPDAGSDTDGSTCASSLRTSSLRDATSRGSSPATYSSRASTKTQNGRSRSSSDALPPRTVHPRASARLASSANRRVLPIPGSPWITSRAVRPSHNSPRARSIASSSAARPTSWSATLVMGEGAARRA